MSSIRKRKRPSCFIANAQHSKAVRAPPMWRCPVGEGANRVMIGLDGVLVMGWKFRGVWENDEQMGKLKRSDYGRFYLSISRLVAMMDVGL